MITYFARFNWIFNIYMRIVCVFYNKITFSYILVIVSKAANTGCLKKHDS